MPRGPIIWLYDIYIYIYATNDVEQPSMSSNSVLQFEIDWPRSILLKSFWHVILRWIWKQNMLPWLRTCGAWYAPFVADQQRCTSRGETNMLKLATCLPRLPETRINQQKPSNTTNNHIQTSSTWTATNHSTSLSTIKHQKQNHQYHFFFRWISSGVAVRAARRHRPPGRSMGCPDEFIEMNCRKIMGKMMQKNYTQESLMINDQPKLTLYTGY